MDLSVSYIYGEALELTKKYGLRVLGLLAIFTVVLMAVSLSMTGYLMYSSGLFDTFTELGAGSEPDLTQILEIYRVLMPVFLVIIPLSMLYYVGYYTYLIAVGREQEMPLFAGFKQAPMTYVKFIVVNLISTLATMVGTLLFVVPGIYLSARLCWAAIHVLDDPDCGIGDALKWSWDKTDGQTFTLIGLGMVGVGLTLGVSCMFSLLSLIVGMAGAVASAIFSLVQMACSFCVGIYVSIAQFKTYVTLADSTSYGK